MGDKKNYGGLFHKDEVEVGFETWVTQKMGRYLVAN